MTEAAYSLRAQLRGLAVSARVRDCGRRAIAPAAVLEVREKQCGAREAWWSGVLRCGRQHSCPVCGARRAAQRAFEIASLETVDKGEPMSLTLPSKARERRGLPPKAVSIGRGVWLMVTFTMRHHSGQKLKPLITALFDAWRATRSTRSVREIFSRRVTATGRALEVNWGERAGWHPHLHVMLRTSEWSDDDIATLEREWLARVPGAFGIAVKWSRTPFKYLAKLGAEIAGIGKKAANGHFNGWQIAAEALAGTDGFGDLWAEYQSAMHGRRILELDERAKAIAALAPPPEEYARVWSLPIYAEEYADLARLERSDPQALWLVLDSVCSTGADPPKELAIYLDDRLGESRRAA